MEKRIATLAAQLIIDDAQAKANVRRNANAAPASLFYRFDGLGRVEAWQRNALVQTAARLATREPLVVAMCCLWLALVASLASVSPAWFHGWAMSASVIFCALPFFFYHRLRVRHHVRQLVGNLAVNQRREERDG